MSASVRPHVRPRRSALYLPAINARAVEKARSLSCDVVILDLEDAVSPDAKDEARAAAAAAVATGGFGPRELVIRVNAADTLWGAEDLAMALHARPHAVLVPKVSTPADLAGARLALGPGIPIWAMIETCAAVLALDELGAASVNTGADVWVIGSNDLAKEMRCTLTVGREPLMTALTMSLMAARAHGLSIVDGVFNDIADGEGLARQCAQGAAWGFDGKSLIHPSQVAPANRAFSPDPDAVAYSRSLVAAFESPEAAGKGVLRVEGRMVERLHLAQAQQTLAIADAIAAREQAG